MTADLLRAMSLSDAERVFDAGLWEIDVASGAARWSPRTCAILGVEPGAAARRDDIRRHFSPEARPEIDGVFDRLMETGAPFSLVARLATPDGQDVWVRCTGAAEMRDGAAIRLFGALRDITGHRRQEQHLRRLAALAERTTDSVIVTDAEGRTVWINGTCTRLTGYTLEDFRGRQPGSLLQCPHTDPGTTARLGEAIRAARPVRAELVNRARDGREYWIEIEIQPIRDDYGAVTGFFAIQSDISHRKAVEVAMARSARLGRIIEDSLNEIFVFDAETLAFVEVNRGARENLGYSADELAAMTPVDIKPEITDADFEALLAPLRDGSQQLSSFRTLHRRRDGSTYPADIRLQLMQGERPVFVAMAQDCTDRDAAEAALIEACERAEAASRAQREFLATMSHEVRTPMNGVLGMAALLDARLRDPQNREMVRILRQSGEALTGVISDILDLVQGESGALTLSREPFRPSDLVARVKAVHGPKAAAKGLSFETVIEESAAAPRLGDPSRVMQILHNLVSNAVKFTESGGVTVVVAGAPGTALRLSVADTGIGMSAEQAARVFDPFSQGDRSATRRFGGAGLGLAIVRRLVAAMGGTIDLDTEPGAGVRVAITLPLAMEAASPAHTP